jgi:hypothetical protein
MEQQRVEQYKKELAEANGQGCLRDPMEDTSVLRE